MNATDNCTCACQYNGVDLWPHLLPKTLLVQRHITAALICLVSELRKDRIQTSGRGAVYHISMAWAINITSHTHSRWCLWRLMRLKISFMYSFFSPFVKHGHQFCHVKPWEIHPNGDLIYLFVISPGDALQPMPTLLRIGYHIVPFE